MIANWIIAYVRIAIDPAREPQLGSDEIFCYAR